MFPDGAGESPQGSFLLEKTMANEEYDLFLQKFERKKTTDDCYTPPEIYEVVKSWAVKRNGWEGREVYRPFYPGGDSAHFGYGVV